MINVIENCSARPFINTPETRLGEKKSLKEELSIFFEGLSVPVTLAWWRLISKLLVFSGPVEKTPMFFAARVLDQKLRPEYNEHRSLARMLDKLPTQKAKLELLNEHFTALFNEFFRKPRIIVCDICQPDGKNSFNLDIRMPLYGGDFSASMMGANQAAIAMAKNKGHQAGERRYQLEAKQSAKTYQMVAHVFEKISRQGNLEIQTQGNHIFDLMELLAPKVIETILLKNGFRYPDNHFEAALAPYLNGEQFLLGPAWQMVRPQSEIHPGGFSIRVKEYLLFLPKKNRFVLIQSNKMMAITWTNHILWLEQQGVTIPDEIRQLLPLKSVKAEKRLEKFVISQVLPMDADGQEGSGPRMELPAVSHITQGLLSHFDPTLMSESIRNLAWLYLKANEMTLSEESKETILTIIINAMSNLSYFTQKKAIRTLNIISERKKSGTSTQTNLIKDLTTPFGPLSLGKKANIGLRLPQLPCPMIPSLKINSLESNWTALGFSLDQIKQMKKDLKEKPNICPLCGEKLVDGFCKTCDLSFDDLMPQDNLSKELFNLRSGFISRATTPIIPNTSQEKQPEQTNSPSSLNPTELLSWYFFFL